MIKKFLTIVVLIIVSLSVFGQSDKEYSKTLKRMFEVSGSEETYQSVIAQMFTMLKQQHPDVESSVWDEFEKEFLKTSIDDLVEMLAQVYSKYLTIADLEDLIGFYETPIGKKFAQNSPLIMQESLQVGQEWGRKIGQEIKKKIKEKGF